MSLPRALLRISRHPRSDSNISWQAGQWYNEREPSSDPRLPTSTPSTRQRVPTTAPCRRRAGASPQMHQPLTPCLPFPGRICMICDKNACTLPQQMRQLPSRVRGPHAAHLLGCTQPCRDHCYNHLSADQQDRTQPACVARQAHGSSHSPTDFFRPPRAPDFKQSDSHGAERGPAG